MKNYNKWSIVKLDLICKEKLKIDQIQVSLSKVKTSIHVNKALGHKLCASSWVFVYLLFS